MAVTTGPYECHVLVKATELLLMAFGSLTSRGSKGLWEEATPNFSYPARFHQGNSLISALNQLFF